ncbi:hypothetical protein [Gloeobacter kilaueensis]|uniref:Uncharacterized protein n=1 Tax=Gloeobacter kilaueensis (strain ATCC BAA-2537 / CCAP 1431/1 / ULC 316 / JS1) TaxID=1183438 RepID=U5QKH2_GLOK1|nr:hypothetical protein [Gloeobacter kilaueensis]AGY59477.1 hypothetical protein GKIL_3231 [Gloeobacter kilaueensis JS1]
MKIQFVGAVAAGLLLATAPGFAQTTNTPTGKPTTTQTDNPRANPTNDQNGPTDESRTDATPYAGTPSAERPDRTGDMTRMEKDKTMQKGTTTYPSSTKPPRTSQMQQDKVRSGKDADRVPVTQTTDLPENQSRPDSAVVAEPPSGTSNVDPNLNPSRYSRPKGDAQPGRDIQSKPDSGSMSEKPR